MKNRLTLGWQKVPSIIRKPIVFTLGLLLIIAAGLTGPLPGPGGIPLFLVGIAILATEFKWAQVVRDWVIARLERFVSWFKSNPFLGALAVTLVIFAFIGLAMLANRYLTSLQS